MQCLPVKKFPTYTSSSRDANYSRALTHERPSIRSFPFTFATNTRSTSVRFYSLQIHSLYKSAPSSRPSLSIFLTTTATSPPCLLRPPRQAFSLPAPRRPMRSRFSTNRPARRTKCMSRCRPRRRRQTRPTVARDRLPRLQPCLNCGEGVIRGRRLDCLLFIAHGP